MMDPFKQLSHWLEIEKQLGSPNPNNIVLATSDTIGIPHSRIVAIREITNSEIIFFTQRDTRKYHELIKTPEASMTLWLPLQQKEIIMDGITQSLSEDENKHYWQTMPKERQIRFSAYAPLSQHPINSLNQLEENAKKLSQQFANQEIPLSPYYVGFRFTPATFFFYTLGTTTFSEVKRFIKQNDSWIEQLLSP